MPDHGVEGVDSTKSQSTRSAGDGPPESGGDHGINGVFGDRFHHGASDFVGTEVLGVATDQSRKHPTRPHKIVHLK